MSNRPSSANRFPLPICSSLSTIIEATVAVSGGARTATAVNDRLGIGTSTTGFALNSAGLLGLLDRDESGATHQWYVTAFGREVLADPRLLHEAVLEVPVVKVFRRDREEAGAMYDRSGDGTSSSIQRGLSCLGAWVEQATGRTIHQASTHNSTWRRDRQPEKLATCPVHHLVLPATGICDDCD